MLLSKDLEILKRRIIIYYHLFFFTVVFSNFRREQMFFIIFFPIKYVIAELQFGTEDSIQQFIIKLLNKAIQNTCKNISHKLTYVAICRLNLPICSTFLLIIVLRNCLHPSFSAPAAVTFYCLPQPLCFAVAQLQQLHIKMSALFLLSS